MMILSLIYVVLRSWKKLSLSAHSILVFNSGSNLESESNVVVPL